MEFRGGVKAIQNFGGQRSALPLLLPRATAPLPLLLENPCLCGHDPVTSAIIMRRILVSGWEFVRSIAPALVYVALYDLARYIPTSIRPPIHTEILARWELGVFGGFPHRWLGGHPSTFQDIFAAIPYQFHFIVPVVFVAFLWRRHRTRVLTFAWCYAVMNLAWMITAILFPTTPPWYFERFGFAPADYHMIGDAAALVRVDQLLGVSLFHNLYRQSTLVFAAFPSMHAAWPALIALFSRGLVRQRTVVALWCYTAWVWWAAMYLQHHYAVDLLGGLVYAVGAWYGVRAVQRCFTDRRSFFADAPPVMPPNSQASSPIPVIAQASSHTRYAPPRAHR